MYFAIKSKFLSGKDVSATSYAAAHSVPEKMRAP
jgi:hypothetical protein